MLDDEGIRQLARLSRHFEDRRTRATDRLKLEHQSGYWFCLLGLRMDEAEFRFGNLATLRAVDEPPGEIEAARTRTSKALMSPIARHACAITHELVVYTTAASHEQQAFNIAWWILGLLRARTLVDILVPAVANFSWSSIAAAPESSCFAQLLEDYPQAHRLDAERTVAQCDLEWVRAYLSTWARLLEVQRFRLAVECLTTHHHHGSLRMSAASLWSGFEALFGISTELRFRLATLAASYLEERGSPRLERYRTIKRHYDFRSKAVHGLPATEDELRDHVRLVRSLLAEVLCRMTEGGRALSAEDFEAQVFQ